MRDLPIPAPQHADARDDRSARQNVREAQAENVAPQRPQFRGAHFEADQKQEHHDTEFGDVKDRFRIVDDTQAVRTDRQTRREVAQHRAQTEPQENRRGHDANSQQRHRLLLPQSTVGHSFRRHRITFSTRRLPCGAL